MTVAEYSNGDVSENLHGYLKYSNWNHGVLPDDVA